MFVPGNFFIHELCQINNTICIFLNVDHGSFFELNKFVQYSQVHYVISLAFLGALQTYTFLETVSHRQ